MNDLGSNGPKQESIFKVYKDKLTNFIGGKKTQLNNSQNIIQTPSAKPTPIINNIPNSSNNNQTPSASKPIPPANNQIVDKPSFAKNVSKTFSGGISNIIIKSIVIILITFFVGYFIVNYQALALKINYWYQVDIKHQQWSKLHPVTLQKAKSTSQKLDENYLYIPVLGIQASVNWGVEEKDVNGMLSAGLVSYLAGATPDTATGNIFIIGNTSGPIWSNGDYKTIFTLLNKIKIDDVVTIIYKNKIYSYRVTDLKSMSNSKIIIAPGDTQDSVLNLLARYPIGINWSTLEVQTKLFKIESNIMQSIEDKIDQLPENINQTQLQPIEVKPTNTVIPIPTDNKIPDSNLLPPHFLPSV